jgi:hypothetical protein
MNKNFSAILIVALVFSLLAILVFIFKFIRFKSRNEGKKKREIITGGSISLFFDILNVTVICYSLDKLGVGRAAGKPQYLKAPYKPERLGALVRYSLQLCKKPSAASDSELLKTLGQANWKSFTEGRKNISVFFRGGTGVVLNSTSRGADGSYQLNKRGYEMVLESDVSDIELGESLLSILRRCR